MINKKIALIVFFVIFIASILLSYSIFSHNLINGLGLPTPNQKYRPPTAGGSNAGATAAASEPKTEECPINGQLFGQTQRQKWEKRRVLGIMVENHTEARPQSGLSSADVIYEAVAEGGITRFLTIFYCQDSAYVGPVRSARIYFLRLLEGYGNYPLYAHVGGANTDGPADALGEIDQLGWGLYNDLNQFAVPFPNFWRDYERLPNRATEHTVYTNTTKLWDYAKNKRDLTNVDKKGKAWDATFEKWKFQDDAKTNERGTVAKISFGFWNLFASDYGVEWSYNIKSNSYKRINGGSAHLDKNTGKQLEAKNIVVVFAKETEANDGYENGQHLLYKIIGSGDGLLFQNGTATKITWNKKTEESMMKFVDESGKEVSIVRGPVFVEILPVGNKVTY